VAPSGERPVHLGAAKVRAGRRGWAHYSWQGGRFDELSGWSPEAKRDAGTVAKTTGRDHDGLFDGLRRGQE